MNDLLIRSIIMKTIGTFILALLIGLAIGAFFGGLAIGVTFIAVAVLSSILLWTTRGAL